MKLTLSADGTGILKWWVDASFAVHPNMRGHSGGGLSLGQGFPIVSSIKQKLNTRSSTETEVVGVDDFMPAICWTRRFMEAQGWNLADNVLYQDNQSAMLLEKNGKASSGKRTKHINIRYFFVTDRIAKGDLNIEWYPTGDMIGDYMTKPLQGSLFRKFRDMIMGAVPASLPNKNASMEKKLTKKSLASSKPSRHRSVLESVPESKESKESNKSNNDRPKRETACKPKSKKASGPNRIASRTGQSKGPKG